MLCSKCGKDVAHNSSAPKNSKASGFYNSSCWNCYLQRNRATVAKRRSTELGALKHREENKKYPTSKEAASKAAKKYRATERTQAKRREYERAVYPNIKDRRKKIAEKHLSIPGKREQYRKVAVAWKKANPHKVNAKTAERRAAKLLRTPIWADMSAIKKVYEEAAKQCLTVDHIIPLQGRLVSGLHVHYNLQLLTKSENSAKKNNYDLG